MINSVEDYFDCIMLALCFLIFMKKLRNSKGDNNCVVKI